MVGFAILFATLSVSAVSAVAVPQTLVPRAQLHMSMPTPITLSRRDAPVIPLPAKFASNLEGRKEKHHPGDHHRKHKKGKKGKKGKGKKHHGKRDALESDLEVRFI